MQYLLSESEYDQLQKKVEAARHAPKKEELQKFCTQVSNEMPIRWTWGDGKGAPKPWGCILTNKSEWYCDQCPAQELCPYPHKKWSK